MQVYSERPQSESDLDFAVLNFADFDAESILDSAKKNLDSAKFVIFTADSAKLVIFTADSAKLVA